MVAGARSFSLEDTFIEPQALTPPPTRHALFIFLVALAAVLHFGTAGWSDLYNGAEGQVAGGAREMLAGHHWLLPTNNSVPRLQTPPLTYWLVIASYKIFGVGATAARLPAAFAITASIALTFLIGERLAGYWRGFAAGLIHLSFAGTFLLGRMVGLDVIFSAFVSATIFCAVCGYQRRRFRTAWFAGVWFCVSLACLTKGVVEGVFYLAGICILSAIFFREARLRFRLLLRWPYLLLFVLIVSPWFVWAEQNFPGSFLHSFERTRDSGLSRMQFLALHFAWWSPMIFLVLPGSLFAARKIIRPHEVTFADVLPLCWMVAGFLPLLLIGHQSVFSSMSIWSAFALWSALVWERAPRIWQVIGVCLLVFVSGALAAIAWRAPEILRAATLQSVPVSGWVRVRPLLEVIGGGMIIFALPAIYLVAKQRAEIALLLLLGPMVAIGLCLAETASRLAPFFSLAEAARFLNPRLSGNGQVVYEGPLDSATSLSFYLNRPFYFLNEPPEYFREMAQTDDRSTNESAVLEKWKQADPIYLIVEQDRVPHWQAIVVERVHIYHQVTTCGRYVVLSNQL